MFLFRRISLVCFLVQAHVFYAQNSISIAEKKAIIKDVKASIAANYVFADKAKTINSALDSLLSSGTYKALMDHKTFADAITTDLIAISKDKHFKVQYRPDLAESRRENGTGNIEESKTQENAVDINYWYAQKNNFGFEKVEILEGNIGYIKLTFFELFEWAKPTIDAAMGFVANTDALLLDLRGNGGGYRSATYLASYFFDEKPMLWNSSYNRTEDETEDEYTFQDIDGKRFIGKPVYILVDEESFSRAEGFAYGMKHFNKATIIGQTTPGAAHGINFLALDHSFFIQVPVERNIHPITKTDWEGIGVIPHIQTTKEESFNLAYSTAIDELIANKKDQALGIHFDRLMKKYRKIKEKISN